MRVKLRLALLAVLAASLLLAGCGHSLKGTTWTGTGLVTGNVSLTFLTDTECQLGIRSVGTTGTYSVKDDTVTVDVLKNSYDFTMNGDTMTGRAYGMTLTLTKQK